MQTSKTSGFDVPRKKASHTTKSNGLTKNGGSTPESIASAPSPLKNSSDGSPRVIQRRSSKTLVIDKTRPTKITELESRITHLQDQLEKTKRQLGCSELEKELAQQEAREAKKRAEQIEDSKHKNMEKQLREPSSIFPLQLEMPKASIQTLQEDTTSTHGDSDNRRHAHGIPINNVCNPLDPDFEELDTGSESCYMKYWQEQIISVLQMQSAFELLRYFKTAYELREAERDELEVKLIETEVLSRNISDINMELNAQLERNQITQIESELGIAELKLELIGKDTALAEISEEVELLRLEMGKRELESRKHYEAMITEAELARACEQEALMRLGYANEEAGKNSRRAARVAEQLEAVQTLYTEMEAELRRLSVQSDQWRKAAEAATAILDIGDGARLVERTGSLDSEFCSVRKLMSFPYSYEACEDSPRKKNTNLLRRIGGLWRKNHK